MYKISEPCIIVLVTLHTLTMLQNKEIMLLGNLKWHYF